MYLHAPDQRFQNNGENSPPIGREMEILLGAI